MAPKLSPKEKQRRKLILEHEFANTTMSHELLAKTTTQLRNMPIAPLIEPFGSAFTSVEKQELYDVITTSPFYRGQSEIVRAWFQLRMQDILERGHLPSSIEIICINEVFGGDLASSITRKALEFLKNHDKETREYVVNPKNAIEAVIFNALVKK